MRKAEKTVLLIAYMLAVALAVLMLVIIPQQEQKRISERKQARKTPADMEKILTEHKDVLKEAAEVLWKKREVFNAQIHDQGRYSYSCMVVTRYTLAKDSGLFLTELSSEECNAIKDAVFSDVFYGIQYYNFQYFGYACSCFEFIVDYLDEQERERSISLAYIRPEKPGGSVESALDWFRESGKDVDRTSDGDWYILSRSTK